MRINAVWKGNMTGFKRFLVVFAAGGLLFLASSCTEQTAPIQCKSTEAFSPLLKRCYPCPAGSVLDRKTASCKIVGTNPEQDVSFQPQDTTEEDWRAPQDTLEEVLEIVDSRDLSPEETDSAPRDTVEQGAIGSSCFTDSACLEGTCFDWPGGYCTTLGCQGNDDCPTDTACLPLLDNGAGCFRRCTSSADCREGYGCKALPDGISSAAMICHPVDESPKEQGHICEDHEECADGLSCLHLGGGKRCVVAGCDNSDNPCNAGQECVWLGWVTACLQSCTEDANCYAAGIELTCEEAADLSEDRVLVCTTPSAGLSIGDSCIYHSECKTNYCHFLVIGTCSDNGDPCSSDESCIQGVCIQNPSEQKGICSDTCSLDDYCSSGLCVDLLSESPVCMTSCNVSEPGPCGPNGLNMSCIFGDTFAPQSPNGTYACTSITPGMAGTECTSDIQCSSGVCLLNQTGQGFCATTCGPGTNCPFGTICGTHANQSLCMKRCFSSLDCGSGFVCEATRYISKKICNPL